MRFVELAPLAGLVALLSLPGFPRAAAQDATAAAAGSNQAQLITGQPFTAIKYARRVKVLPDGKLQFIRNERYPTRIARDADGRLMMQVISSYDLFPECDSLDLPVPPVCPDWNVFVIDPVAHTVTHWVEGERAGKSAADFPLTQSRLQEAAAATSALPGLGPDFTEQDGEVSDSDLGDRTIEGVRVHGVRWTLRYDTSQDGQTAHRTRIHEVWTSEEMQLIVRVIDGDPNGEETVWGLEKVSVAPDAALFHSPDTYRVPDGYGTHHNKSDSLCWKDFEDLKSWFAQ
jgi:hypothetical protein